MSGPKVSQVNLDIQRRAELQRERERKSKIIFEIKNKVRILNNFNVKTIDSNISDKLTKKLELLKEKFYKSLNNISNKANISKSFAELEVINRDSEKILREFKEDYESIFKNIETTNDIFNRNISIKNFTSFLMVFMITSINYLFYSSYILL